jgi:hypothetical protein
MFQSNILCFDKEKKKQIRNICKNCWKINGKQDKKWTKIKERKRIQKILNNLEVKS